jgi:hypothetical protein
VGIGAAETSLFVYAFNVTRSSKSPWL